ncbi:MAG TPA: hypothetical protein VIV12_05455 [Streptosporangiaceae bacterium]
MTVLRRLIITPFESAIAALLVISGAAQLLGAGLIDPVRALLPPWEAAALSWLSVGTGLVMMAGSAAAAKGAEICGLLLLVAVITCRFLLYGVYLGFGSGFVVTGVFDTAVVAAALARLWTVGRGDVIVRVRGGSHGLGG